MTEKKEQLLDAALALFATHGYNAVSTSRIAKQAQVSEGLIFRHFGNKQGLLQAIMDQAFERASALYEPIIKETDPREVLKKTIQLPFSCEGEEYHFWKLLFKLKWELELTEKEHVQPLMDKMVDTFDQLGYKNPTMEAHILHHLLESVFGSILREGAGTQDFLKNHLLEKYGVSH